MFGFNKKLIKQNEELLKQNEELKKEVEDYKRLFHQEQKAGDELLAIMTRAGLNENHIK